MANAEASFYAPATPLPSVWDRLAASVFGPSQMPARMLPAPRAGMELPYPLSGGSGDVPFAPTNARYKPMAGLPTSQTAGLPSMFSMVPTPTATTVQNGVNRSGGGESNIVGNFSAGGGTEVEKDELALLQDEINKRYGDMANSQRAGGNKLQDQLKELMGMDLQYDLSPLLGLVDSQTGSNLRSSYAGVETVGERRGEIQELEQAISGAKTKAAGTEIEGLKTKAGGLFDLKKLEQSREEAAAKLQLDKERNSIEWAKLDAERSKAGNDIKDTQWLAGLYGHRMRDSNNILGNIYADKNKLAKAVKWTSISNSLTPDFMKDGQKLEIEQAERNFITAVLRKESGAAISDTEYDSAEKNYFPRPGDDENTVKNKNAARNRAIEGMRLSSGAAWGRFKKSAADGGDKGATSGGDMDAPLEALLAERAKRSGG